MRGGPGVTSRGEHEVHGQAAEPMSKKKQKGTNLVPNSTGRMHAIMGFGEACHKLHRPMLPTPQLSTKRELQSNTDGPWPDSQQKAWRV